MSAPAENAHTTLATVDRMIDEASPQRCSLSPDRSRARPLSEIIDAISGRYEPIRGTQSLVDALSLGLAEVARAQLRAFPGNLFWDFEFMAASVMREAVDSAGPAQLARTRMQQIAGLQHLYGRETAIRFTYVHDFVYGYDWVKWIARDPPPRRHHGPYSAAFLHYMETRGQQLLALISSDDRKYPTLRDRRPRNAFPFSREPANEVRLHQDLARRRQLPIEAWKIDANPTWNRRYAAIRAERARVLSHHQAPHIKAENHRESPQ